MSIQKHFIAQDCNILLATIPKSGTTWLKALIFAIVNRKRFGFQYDHPLLKSNPHEFVPFLEYKLYADNRVPDLSILPCPRLLATHMPLAALPETVEKSNCRLIYICQNPFDTFVSIWHYLIKLQPESPGPLPLEEAFDLYCREVIGVGPYWDHMLGSWNASLESPHKVLFLMYEDMKKDTTFHIKKLAKFIGFPFSLEEEKEGVIDEISNLCSFETMKDLEVNKKEKGAIADFENKYLFRKAEIGDWVNYLTPLIVERLGRVMKEKLRGSSLSFRVL